jgi:dihydrofolate reductase
MVMAQHRTPGQVLRDQEQAMRRKTFDAILTAGGLVLAVVLLVAGGLLMWANNFVTDQVHSQLSAEKIFIPAAGSEALADPAIKPYLTKYGGQQLVNGKQAKAYADHFILVHMNKASGGKTYAEVGGQQTALRAEIAKAKAANQSTEALDKQLADLTATRETLFKGDTLRGLLLNAYAFDTMGRIAGIAAVASFVGAGVMLLLSLLGLLHLRRTPVDAEIVVPGWHPESTTA